ncbi:hypothetical protein LguiA_002935 [Lonicera macranthoides]
MLRRIPSHYSSITQLEIDGNKSGLPLGGLLRNGTSLRSLVIRSCDKELCLAKNTLQSCTSLEDLTISKCGALVSLPDLHFLTRLTSLTLGAFSEGLDYFPWPSSSSSSLSSSQGLHLIGWPKLESLPEPLQHLSSLTELWLKEFYGLEALPNWLGSLSSLEVLKIWACKKLTTLPTAETMRCLTKLQYLNAIYSHLLKESCAEGSGLEWHKIAHISNLIIS